MQRYRLLIATVVFATVPLAAPAQEPPRREWPSHSQRWTPQNPECTCRAQGRDFRMGDAVCLNTANGSRLATCAMVLNNTSWELSETPCTTSRAASSAAKAL